LKHVRRERGAFGCRSKNSTALHEKIVLGFISIGDARSATPQNRKQINSRECMRRPIFVQFVGTSHQPSSAVRTKRLHAPPPVNAQGAAATSAAADGGRGPVG
jgi:hypothetical protein